MYGLNLDATAAELDYRRERVAADFRSAAAIGRVLRRHRPRRADRTRVF